jgi:hypothetical protein
MQDPLDELTTAPRIPIAAAVRRARADIRAAVADALAVPDEALERPWRWRAGDPHDLDARYGLYRLHERLEEAIAAVARRRASDGGDPAGPGVELLAASGTARWELHGALAGLSATDWDADPGGGEWTVRRTLGHVVASQRSYGWTNAWFLTRADLPDAGEYAPDGALPPEPDEVAAGAGAPAEVLATLDRLIDQSIECLAGVDAPALAVRARWSGVPVTFEFRLVRLGSHLREHTIQVDKTWVMLGRPVREVERIARLVLGSYGRLEALVVGRPESPIGPDLEIVEAAARDAAATAADVRASVAGQSSA